MFLFVNFIYYLRCYYIIETKGLVNIISTRINNVQVSSATGILLQTRQVPRIPNSSTTSATSIGLWPEFSAHSCKQNIPVPVRRIAIVSLWIQYLFITPYGTLERACVFRTKYYTNLAAFGPKPSFSHTKDSNVPAAFSTFSLYLRTLYCWRCVGRLVGADSGGACSSLQQMVPVSDKNKPIRSTRAQCSLRLRYFHVLIKMVLHFTTTKCLNILLQKSKLRLNGQTNYLCSLTTWVTKWTGLARGSVRAPERTATVSFGGKDW